MSDDYEQFYFGGRTNASPLIDGDDDGFNNLDEFVAKTDPTNKTSFFRIAGWTGDQERILFYPSATGRLYDVQYSTNAMQGVWVEWLTNVVGSGADQWIVDTNSASQRIYRLGVRLE